MEGGTFFCCCVSTESHYIQFAHLYNNCLHCTLKGAGSDMLIHLQSTCEIIFSHVCISKNNILRSLMPIWSALSAFLPVVSSCIRVLMHCTGHSVHWQVSGSNLAIAVNWVSIPLGANQSPLLQFCLIAFLFKRGLSVGWFRLIFLPSLIEGSNLDTNA